MRAAAAVAALALAIPGLAASGSVDAAGATVGFEIDLRDEIAAGRFDPVRDRVGVRGSLPPLSWQRSRVAVALGDGRYAAEVRFERLPYGGQPVQVKFHIERGAAPNEGTWEPGRNHPLVLSAGPLRVARRFGEPPPLPPVRRAGLIERLGPVASRHVAPREVQVWLPPRYAEDASRRYPVLYLHDGQNVFDGEAAGAEWMVDETAQRLALAGRIEPPIVVAVHSTSERIDDYTPTPHQRPSAGSGTGVARPVGGGAAAYARFLVDELKPLIDARYRTRATADATAVGGSSLGGLVSLWLVLEHPATFGAALVVSPALWWDGFFARRDVLARPLQGRSRPRVWLDSGLLEGDGVVDAARQLRQALMARGWSATTLAYSEDAHGVHDETSWASRVEAMLLFLYGRPDAVP